MIRREPEGFHHNMYRRADVYASDAGRGDAVVHAASALEKLGVTVEQGGHDLARIARCALVVASPGSWAIWV